MKRYLQKEWKLLSGYSSRICLITVLTVFSGILMWVHGNTASWMYRYVANVPFTPNFTVFFLLWLLLYACNGVTSAVFMLPIFFRSRHGLRFCTVNFFAYVLILAWYPLFFSGVHIFLAFIVLFLAVLLQIFHLIRWTVRLYILIPLHILTALLESYFLYVTFIVSWIN